VTIVEARPADAERLALLSHGAKQTFSAWAPRAWRPPSLAVERARWTKRLHDPAGYTIVAGPMVGAVHVTQARTSLGDGEPIAGLAHLSGLFVEPSRWNRGIGGALLDAALAELRLRRYSGAELFTATANARSRTFYERRAWQPTDIDSHEHDGLWLTRYAREIELA
jgi:GNAT superfamily N-acetyltransferase